MAEPSLQLGNGNWAVKSNNLLAYHKVVDNFYADELTFTRASTGTRVNADGLIEEAATNIARVDYTNNASGQLLLEPQRTNLVTYSEDHTQTNKEACTTSGGILAPDGSMNAWKIVEDTTVDEHVCITDNPTKFSAGEVGTCSVYVKAAERTSARIWFHHITLNQYAYVEYNLITGAFIQSGGVNGVFVDSTIVAMDDGWWAVSITGYKNVSTYSWSPAVSPLDSNGDVTYLGDGVSGVYMWGGQTERGATYRTSYIPTSGTTVTRIKDTSVTTGLSSVINSQVGSITFNLSIVAEAAASYIDVSDGATNAFRVLFDGTNTTFRYYVAASLVAQTVEATPQENVDSVKTTYSNGDVRFYINDVLVGTHLAVGTLASNTLSVLDFSPTNFVLYGRINSVILT